MPERVVIGMSGGVDSSVAAARLVDRGFDVVGVTLHLWSDLPDGQRSRCCAPEDIRDARRVADQLGIPHYTVDRRELFSTEIVEPFVDAYLGGRTPSPCPQCNASVKLPALRGLARLMGARKVATGHYARTLLDAPGGPRIARGRDRHKDQSYFLYDLDADTLAALELPLGDSLKTDVREEALRRGLVAASKGESQDLCIVPDGDYARFVESRAPDRARGGFVVDREGRPLGRHTGVHRFTIGQRKGLGVAAGKPLFVTGIDASRGLVVVGGEEALLARAVVLRGTRVARGVALPARVHVQVRYRHEGAPAEVEADGAGLRMRFDHPVRAASPGQVAVAYLGDQVIAGGVIDRVEPWEHCDQGDPGGNIGA